jgi:urease accessory protein
MAQRLREAVRSGFCLGHIAAMQGAVWQSIGLDEELAQVASAYGVASGGISAAVRLGAIGALEGQKVLRGCFPLIGTLVAEPVSDNAKLSSFVPFLEIAAARHARADLQLFVN